MPFIRFVGFGDTCFIELTFKLAGSDSLEAVVVAQDVELDISFVFVL